MKTFTTLNVVSKISNPQTGEVVEILKVQKDGTKRIFFKPVVEKDGKKMMITKTLWARLYDANRLAKNYLNRHLHNN
ncbi:hypothetical protein [Elizabethkingia ursingii]